MKFEGEAPTSVVANLPKSDGSYMFGHDKPPNAFVYKENGRICILPVTGGWIGINNSRDIDEEEAPFAD